MPATFELLGNTAAPMVEGAVYELAVFFRMDSQIAVNVHHFQVRQGVGAPAPLPNQGQAVRAADLRLHQAYVEIVSARAVFFGYRMRNVDTELGASEVLMRWEGETGGIQGSPLPMQVCGLIVRRSGQSGPKGRSRTFVPFPAADNNTFTSGEPRPSRAYQNALSRLATALSGSFALQSPATLWGGTFGIWSRKSLGFHTYVTVTPRDIWATQRKRGSLGKTNPLPF